MVCCMLNVYEGKVQCEGVVQLLYTHDVMALISPLTCHLMNYKEHDHH